MDLRPVPKPSHNRRVAKRGERGKFSAKTIKEIFERDNYQCVRCGTGSNLESVPHHIIYRSQGGIGHKRNGATICLQCHAEAHLLRESRKWFENWRDRTLDENGNRHS